MSSKCNVNDSKILGYMLVMAQVEGSRLACALEIEAYSWFEMGSWSRIDCEKEGLSTMYNQQISIDKGAYPFSGVEWVVYQWPGMHRWSDIGCGWQAGSLSPLTVSMVLWGGGMCSRLWSCDVGVKCSEPCCWSYLNTAPLEFLTFRNGIHIDSPSSLCYEKDWISTSMVNWFEFVGFAVRFPFCPRSWS